MSQVRAGQKMISDAGVKYANSVTHLCKKLSSSDSSSSEKVTSQTKKQSPQQQEEQEEKMEIEEQQEQQDQDDISKFKQDEAEERCVGAI